MAKKKYTRAEWEHATGTTMFGGIYDSDFGMHLKSEKKKKRD